MLNDAPVPSAAPPGPLLPVYPPFPVTPVSGRGCTLVDAEGREWLDFYGGHAVASTGHSHPRVVAAIAAQAAELLFYSSAVALPIRERLAVALAERLPAGLGRLFFCNSGAEANENALLLARRATGRTAVLALEGGFHGRTAATQAVTDGARYERNARQAGLTPARKLPFGDLPALEAALDESIAALILEPVQGMAGARSLGEDYLRAARSLCDAHGALLIFDEIQCGVGRTGAFTAAELFGVVPDLLTLAKGLAAGLPIGAVAANERAAAGLTYGDLGSTFVGGPVVCAAALANLEVISDEGLCERAAVAGRKLATDSRTVSGVVDVQGCGLLLGLRLDRPASSVQRALWGHRVLAGTASDPAVLRLMPPLCVSDAELERFLEALRKVMS